MRYKYQPYLGGVAKLPTIDGDFTDIAPKEQTCKLFDFGANPREECNPQRASVAIGANAPQATMGGEDKSDPLQIAEKKEGEDVEQEVVANLYEGRQNLKCTKTPIECRLLVHQPHYPSLTTKPLRYWA